MRDTKEQPFTIVALDANLDTITMVPYSNLQWNRKYHEPGTFSIVLNNKVQYTKDWKYIYTSARPEMGRISQVNWSKKNNVSTVTISGKFLEEELNNMICYPKPTYFASASGSDPDIGVSVLAENSPTWISKEGTADEVATAFFNGFKQLNFKNYEIGDFSGTTLKTKNFVIPIELSEVEAGEYKYSAHTRNGEKLGSKLYDILNESKASFRISFNFEKKLFYMNIIHGKDRTASNLDINPCVLSTQNGTISEASLVTSNTDTKDTVLQYSEGDDLTMVMINTKANSSGRIIAQSMNINRNDYLDNGTITEDAKKKFRLDTMANASDTLRDKTDKFNFQFSAVNGSYEYMEDFDIGDMISIEVPEIDLSLDAQIVGCYEVVKNGIWTLSLEVGRTILRKRGNF